MTTSTMSSQYTLKTFARCVASQFGIDEIRFLVGTAALREQNEIEILSLDEESGKLSSVCCLPHPDEVVHLAPSPSRPDLLLTCHSSSGDHRGTLWKLPAVEPVGEASSSSSLKAMASLPDRLAPNVCGRSLNIFLTLRRAKWQALSAFDDDSEEASLAPLNDKMAVIDAHSVSFCRVREAEIECESSHDFAEDASPLPALSCVSWNPHSIESVCLAMGPSIVTWDARSNAQASSFVAESELHPVTSLDFNPNCPHVIVTGGESGDILFWDLRKTASSLKSIRQAHSHWVTSVKFNPFHDQLLTSSGTDGKINLWRMSSISSAPLLEYEVAEEEGGVKEEEEEDSVVKSQQPPPQDSLIAESVTSAEDSVCSVAWSASSAWVFAGVSADGRVHGCSVPSAEKYRILL